MKFPQILSFLLIFSIGAFAQGDKKSQEILKGVTAKYNSYKSLKATFSVSVENPKDKSKQSQSGTLYLKGDRYHLQIAGQEIISDGKTRWTYLKDANEVQIDVQKADETNISPTNIFTIYQKGWTSKFISESAEGKSTVQNIELIPTDPKGKNIFKIKLKINKSERNIASAIIYDKSGSIQNINVDKLIADGGSEDALYTFNAAKYPGAEIVDLR